MTAQSFSQQALKTFLEERRPDDSPGRRLTEMRMHGLDRLPCPGNGHTLQRWRALAQVAAFDLSLCKLFEGHTDALAIFDELNVKPQDMEGTWGLWAAESPDARVRLDACKTSGEIRLTGCKAWCSGAAELNYALLTGWDHNGRQQLVAIPLNQPGLAISDGGWCAVGMAATRSFKVHFDDAWGFCIGDPDAYRSRPGFWHGAGGVAACWYGAAQALGEALRRHCAEHDEPHALAHLGALDSVLQGAAAALRSCAQWIDRHPQQNAELQVRRARAVCELAAESAIRHTGHALGAYPYCNDEDLARHLSGLPVYLRQSHAERDLALQGRMVANENRGGWML
jgi:alkylation response protein AidB-like acyl-CoA dehydrogenase